MNENGVALCNYQCEVTTWKYGRCNHANMAAEQMFVRKKINRNMKELKKVNIESFISGPRYDCSGGWPKWWFTKNLLGQIMLNYIIITILASMWGL